MKTVSVLLLTLCAGALAIPKPEDYQYDDFGESEFAAEEHANTIGKFLQNLPNILKKTASWISDLGEIGDDVHPDVGSAIRKGADAVEEASNSVPDDLHTKIQGHLKKLINVTRDIQENLNDTWSNIPQLKDSVDGLPGQDYILDVIESIPSSDYVDEQISEAINYFEPLAEAIGVQGNKTSVAA